MARFGYDTTAEEVARTVDLRGRRAVLTGASSGIGVETARALAHAGADVVLGVRDPEKVSASRTSSRPARQARSAWCRSTCATSRRSPRSPMP
jgi:NAD(P)-dependent dehydrogenase (short-subunit alcohol dehydrogenase family)